MASLRVMEMCTNSLRPQQPCVASMELCQAKSIVNDGLLVWPD